MAVSRNVTINTAELLSQHDPVAESNKIALTMGAFSIALLLIISSILSVLHHLFS